VHYPSNGASGKCPPEKQDIENNRSYEYPQSVFESLMDPGSEKQPEAITQLVVITRRSDAPFLNVEIYTVYPDAQYNNCKDNHNIKSEAQCVERHLISSSIYLPQYRGDTTVIGDKLT
jgi:hypothetical protein